MADASLCDEVRASCARIAARARWIQIDLDRAAEVQPAPPPDLDPELHLLEGPDEEVARFMLALDSINFGSGWFPTLRKPGGRSGYETNALALTAFCRAEGVLDPRALRGMTQARVARILGQDAGHELMGLYARALNDLGAFLGDRGALDVIAEAGGSAEALARSLTAMPLFDDPGFFKRAQITANDLALAGVAQYNDLDRLTIFADNVVPHVLRVDGVLVYDEGLGARIDAGELLEPGPEEREIRACAVHACEAIAEASGIAPRTLDGWLWHRGRRALYKARPRHRTRTTAY